MRERFIERGTDYNLKYGKLSVYETNSACKDVMFYFEQFVITIMLDGHKTVESEEFKIEFFPGLLFIPASKIMQSVAIPNASFDNPTKCLVLEFDPSFLQEYYEEIAHSNDFKHIIHTKEHSEDKLHYCSNEPKIIEAFKRLYENQFTNNNPAKDLLDSIHIKELLSRLFQTEAVHLLKKNFEFSVRNPKIQKSIAFIKENYHSKITVDDLALVSGYGLTSFYNKFKTETGISPTDFILRERINQSKILIKKNKIPLKEIAFRSGFNSYEYFCSSFKKVENCKPSDYLKQREYAIAIG
tara:strand:- start:6567 stop:7460 length:894 start_codon:yes stop_codon:yes gene_type:complete